MAEPMYWRIAQDIRRKIESGELAEGAKLPTEENLSKEHSASRNTIRDAIKWLTSRTLVETRPGQGTFVTVRPKPFVTTLSPNTETGLGGGEGAAAFSEVRERGRTAFAEDPKIEVKSAEGHVKEGLGIADETQVVSRKQKQYIDKIPWSLQTTYYPMELILRGAVKLLSDKDIPNGAVAYLEEELGIVQIGYRDWILVRQPDEEEAAFFGLPDDGRIAVLYLVRAGYQESEAGITPFRLTTTALPADRNQLVINSHKVPPELAAPLVINRI